MIIYKKYLGVFVGKHSLLSKKKVFSPKSFPKYGSWLLTVWLSLAAWVFKLLSAIIIIMSVNGACRCYVVL